MVVQRLRREHRMILAVLDAVEQQSDVIAHRCWFDAAAIGGLVEFLRDFVHGVHLTKEEHWLFVGVERRIAATAQVSLVPLLRSHDNCRRELRMVMDLLLPAVQGEPSAALSLGGGLNRYCSQLRSHIREEEEVLFPLAESLLSASDRDALLRQCRGIDLASGSELPHKYRQIARALAREAPLRPMHV